MVTIYCANSSTDNLWESSDVDFFVDPMPFLASNQWSESTDGKQAYM